MHNCYQSEVIHTAAQLYIADRQQCFEPYLNSELSCGREDEGIYGSNSLGPIQQPFQDRQ